MAGERLESLTFIEKGNKDSTKMGKYQTVGEKGAEE